MVLVESNAYNLAMEEPYCEKESERWVYIRKTSRKNCERVLTNRTAIAFRRDT